MCLSMIAFVTTLCAYLASLAASTRIYVPDRCPSQCSTDITSTFEACRTKAFRGCTMEYCSMPGPSPGDEPRMGTTCVLQRSGPDRIRLRDAVSILRASPGEDVTLSVDLPSENVPTDIYLLIDSTGSMATVVHNIQTRFKQLAEALGESSRTAFGIGIFRDERDLTNGFENVQSITTDVDAANSALRSIYGRGGRDGPEANLAALHTVATSPEIGWRGSSRRVILYVGDAPGHEPTCLRGGVRLTRENVAAALKNAVISVIPISYPRGALDRDTTSFGCEVEEATREGQGTYLAEQTGGRYLGGWGASIEVDAVVDAIDSLTKRVTLRHDSCEEHVDVSYKPELPAIVPAHERLAVTLQARRSMCGASLPWRCELQFAQQGHALTPLVIRYDQLQDC